MAEKKIMPLVRNEEGWHIDASELTPDCPLWGPYSTKIEANEDRRPSFVARVRAARKQRAKNANV
jgi:hypothetical protein